MSKWNAHIGDGGTIVFTKPEADSPVIHVRPGVVAKDNKSAKRLARRIATLLNAETTKGGFGCPPLDTPRKGRQ